jgi:hypothetical protein
MQSFARQLAGKRRTAPSNLARKRSFARYAGSRSLRLAPMQSFVRQPAGNGRTAPSAPTLQRKEKHMDITPQVLKVDPLKPYIVESRFPHSHYVRDTRDGSFIEFENVEAARAEADKLNAEVAAAQDFYVWGEVDDGSQHQFVATSFATHEEAERIAAQLAEQNDSYRYFVTTKGRKLSWYEIGDYVA